MPSEMATRRPRFWFLLLAIGAIGPVAVYANNGTVPILVAACLGMPQPRQAFRDVRRLLTTPCGLALIAVVGWSLISTLWAPGGTDAAVRLLKVVAIMLAGVLFIAAIGQLDAAERRSVGYAFVVAVAAIVVLVIVEIPTGGTPAVDAKAAQSSRFVFVSDLLGTAAPGCGHADLAGCRDPASPDRLVGVVALGRRIGRWRRILVAPGFEHRCAGAWGAGFWSCLFATRDARGDRHLIRRLRAGRAVRFGLRD